MPDEFKVMGYGPTRAAARDDAEKRLRYKPDDTSKYRYLIQNDPTKQEDDSYEMTIVYALSDEALSEMASQETAAPRHGRSPSTLQSSRPQPTQTSVGAPRRRGTGAGPDSETTEAIRALSQYKR